MKLTPKNWADFQHYKDRSPPWIKLHKTLLNDRAFMMLPIASKALAPLLWLLASESKSANGEFDASTEELEFRLHMSAKEIEAGRKSLIDKGFFIVASSVLAGCQQPAIPETETETEVETEKSQRQSATVVATRFDDFWTAWPKSERKQDKSKCSEKWKAEKLDAVCDLILADIAVKKQTEKWKGGFIEAPLVYLNNKRWEDGVMPQGVVPAAMHDPDSRASIEAEGIAKGVGPWNEGFEHWHIYKAKVRGTAQKTMSIGQLTAMAQQRAA